MTEFKFKSAPARKPTATIDVYDTEGESYGEFTVYEQNQYSPLFGKRLADARKLLSPADRKRIENPKTEDDILLGRKIVIRNFVDHYLESCKIPKGDGKGFYGKEAALEYFTHPDMFWVFIEVDSFSSELGNFRAEAVEESKND